MDLTFVSNRYKDEKCVCKRLNADKDQGGRSGFLINNYLKINTSENENFSITINGSQKRYRIDYYDKNSRSLAKVENFWESNSHLMDKNYYCRHNNLVFTYAQLKDIEQLVKINVSHIILVEYLKDVCGFNFSKDVFGY